MKSSILVCAALCMSSAGLAMGDIVEVTPTNMNGWTLNAFDPSGAIDPAAGTAQMVTGPATPPLGVGSAQLATNVDGAAAAIATEQFDGTLLSSLTSLSYSAYDKSNNGQQFPYLALSIDTNDPSGDVDTLFFEPPYQQPSTGGSAVTDNQGPTVLNEWQNWDAFNGAFWDGDAFLGNGNGGYDLVSSLASYEALFPNATIANGGYPGLGGIALQVGFASGNLNGYVDDFTIGINGVDTTYDFEPGAAVPLPATLSTSVALLAGLGIYRVMRRKAATA